MIIRTQQNTYVNVDAFDLIRSRWRIIPGYVVVELFPALEPLHCVQLAAFQVVNAVQLCCAALDHMSWHRHLGYLEACTK